MGNGSSSPATSSAAVTSDRMISTAADNTASSCPIKSVQHKDKSMEVQQSPADVNKVSRCPLGFGKRDTPNQEASSEAGSGNQAARGECPMKGKTSAKTQVARGECPMKGNASSGEGVKYKHPFVYNVYSQPIDPLNQMPSTANQQPAPNQKSPLSVDRVQSTIPKGGTDDGTWMYPSPQMVRELIKT